MIQSKLLSKFPELIHGFSIANPKGDGSGNMSLSRGEAEQTIENRHQFCLQLGIANEHIIMADQIHSATIIPVTDSDLGKGAITELSPLGQGDALTTMQKGLPLSVLVADCAAVFCYARECVDADSKNPGRAIGLAHSGWRGTAAGIVSKLINKMAELYLAKPGKMHFWISPCIGSDSFEVGEDVIDIFKEKQPSITTDSDWFRSNQNPGKYLLDLKELIFRQLTDGGVPQCQIDLSPDCTYQNPLYFSYRRQEKGAGHMMGVLAIAPFRKS